MTALSNVMLGLIMGLVITFVLVNIVVGCESWSNDACVTPSEFIGMF
jgi:hypothetical protein